MADGSDAPWELDEHDAVQFWRTTQEIRAWIAAEPKRQEAADERAAAIIKAQHDAAKAVAIAVREGLADVAEALRRLELVSD